MKPADNRQVILQSTKLSNNLFFIWWAVLLALISIYSLKRCYSRCLSAILRTLLWICYPICALCRLRAGLLVPLFCNTPDSSAFRFRPRGPKLTKVRVPVCICTVSSSHQTCPCCATFCVVCVIPDPSQLLRSCVSPSRHCNDGWFVSSKTLPETVG